jgi:hypothetical protein
LSFSNAQLIPKDTNMIFQKIGKAKKGVPISISPEELNDSQFEHNQRYTIADLISICESYGLPYNLSTDSFNINPTGPVVESFLDEDELEDN